MSVNNNQGAVDVHSLERDTWRTRREAGELDNLVCLVVPPFCDRMTHMLTFFLLRLGEVLLLINSTQTEASTGAFIEKYRHVVPHMVGMTKEGIYLQS